jgi:NADH-ubiquinone oxidoreductase chain 2
MILTTALNNGYIFISFIAILTSVISAVYYLFVIKTIFSEEKVYKYSSKLPFSYISSSLSLPISIITLLLTIYMIDSDLLTINQLNI